MGGQTKSHKVCNSKYVINKGKNTGIHKLPRRTPRKKSEIENLAEEKGASDEVKKFIKRLVILEETCTQSYEAINNYMDNHKNLSEYAKQIKPVLENYDYEISNI